MKMKNILAVFVLFCGAPSMRAGGNPSEKVEGDKVWSVACQQCHNRPNPASHSNAQWDVIIHHMRVRGNLTGMEARAVLEFIKDAK